MVIVTSPPEGDAATYRPLAIHLHHAYLHLFMQNYKAGFFSPHSLLTALLFLLFGSLNAQSIDLKGIVSDEEGNPLIGVSVMDTGTSTGTVTDFDGAFQLTVKQGAILRMSYTGFESQDIEILSGAPLSITLASQSELLDEIVVIGYGTTKKSDLTGSVASVKSKDLSKTTITTLEQGLQGRLSGVQVTQGDAAPGAGMSIQIRGTNSILGGSEPLYVVDGIPITNPAAGQGDLGASEPNNRIASNTNVLSTISPSDIESIEVLKDASATAIYGSRGANGVVLITTKKGKEGKGQVSLNISYGLAEVNNKIKLLDAEQFVNYQVQAFQNAGLPVEAWPFIPDSITGLNKPSIGGVIAARDEVEVDWQDLIFQTAPVQDYQLGFSGGSAKGNYSVMLNYLDQKGVIRGSSFTRGGFRTNVGYQVTERINVSGNLSVTRSQNSLVRTSTNTTGSAGGIIRSALNYTPVRPVQRNEDGEVVPVENPPGEERLEDPSFFQLYGANPLRYTDEVTEEQNLTRIIGGVSAGVKLFGGLSADFRLAANFLDRKNNTYYPRTVAEGFGLNGLAVVSGNEFSNLIGESLLRYSGEIGNGRLTAVAGYTYETNRDFWINNEARNFPDDVLSFYSLQRGLSHVPTRTNTAKWELASYLGRVNYALADKYLFTGTFRYDGSSKFATNNKWAPFYSFAFAWRASEEPFLKRLSSISNLKVRLSYGQSGNQAVSPYQSLATIEGVTTSFNNQLVPAVIEGRLQNENLRWETTAQANLGVDLELYGGRLFTTLDYYQKTTDDLLQSITLAPNTGFTTALVNSGSIENKGFEFSLGGFPVRGEFSWELTGNLSVNRNEITDLGNVTEQFANRLGSGDGLSVFPFIQRPGLPIGTIYGFVEDGIFQNEGEVSDAIGVQPNAQVGQIRYKDVNGDGSISDADRTVIGDVNPDYIWGISNAFSWKAFDFSFLFQGVAGADVVNTLNIRFHNLDGRRNIPAAVYENAWTGEGTSNEFRQINLNNGTSRFSDRFVEDGSFIRLKNIQLGYTLPAKTISWLSGARVYVNAINVLTFSDYSGFDPEVSAFSGAAMRGVDLGNYPQSRTIMFGLNLNFN